MTRHGRYPGVPLPPGAVLGKRLADRKDPAVRAALRIKCPTCLSPPKQWCIGTSGTTMRGRRLTRIHFRRCTFKEPQ